MKIVLWIVLLLVGVAVAVTVIGWSLPVEHRSVVTRTIPAPADEVWTRIVAVDDWTSWRTDLLGVKRVGEDRAVVTDSNGSVRYRIERTGDRTLVTTIDQEGLPYGGRWIWTVHPEGDEGSTSVTIVEEGEVYNPFFRFVSRFVLGREATLRSVVDLLVRSFSESSSRQPSSRTG